MRLSGRQPGEQWDGSLDRRATVVQYATMMVAPETRADLFRKGGEPGGGGGGGETVPLVDSQQQPEKSVAVSAMTVGPCSIRGVDISVVRLDVSPLTYARAVCGGVAGPAAHG